MNPIYIQEQEKHRGIGYDLDSFLRRFEQICQEHLQKGRARAFAFIFYDFQDNALRRILKEQGVFTQLDRLSGSNLSVFYLHTDVRCSVKKKCILRSVVKFNKEFLSVLGVEKEVQFPCVVFFRYKDQTIHDIAIAQIDNANFIQGFHELYGVIECYTKEASESSIKSSRYLKWLKAGVKAIAKQVAVEALSRYLGF
jgi:hypothetical protein